MSHRTCQTQDCYARARRSGLCWGHLWQRANGRPSTPIRHRYATPWEMLFEAAMAFAEANSGDDIAYERARHRLRKAALAYADALRSRHPGNTPHPG